MNKALNNPNRRTLLKRSIVTGAAALVSVSACSKSSSSASQGSSTAVPTPAEIEGPFYPLTPQKDKDFDLTRLDGKDGVAQGQAVFIEGQVLDTRNQPIENATVDLWQANAAGKYRHPHDASTAPLDPYFQGWAIVQSGKNGEFRFKTIIPGAYAVSNEWTRPPHIHFKVSKKGFLEVITQMYFPNQTLNKTDLLLQRKTPEEQNLMVAKTVDGKAHTLKFNIVLQAV